MEEIEEQWKTYRLFVEDLAEKKFNEVVRPMLIRHKFTFLAGNGDYWFRRQKDGSLVNQYDLKEQDKWKPIFDLLETEIPGMPQINLGCIMPNHPER